MNDLQMLKRKFVLRNWIRPSVTNGNRVDWYKGLLAQRKIFNPKRLP